MKRIIMLADANSFFASCHIAEQPELENKEVIVAGDPKRRTGIVLAASYPAKAKGVKTGMARWEAQKICPDAFFFTPDYALYIEYSTKMLKIMRDFTDRVESFSIDEAFLNCTGVLKLFNKTPLQLAQHLMERMHFPRLVGHQLKQLLSGSRSFSRNLPDSHSQGLNAA